MAQLDDLDRQLISALRADGREPVTTLAKRLGVSRATVTSRIDRLVDSGVVLGFTVRVREEAQVDQLRAISLISVEGRSTNAVIHELRGLPEVHALYSTNGGWDLVAELRVSSLQDFDHLLGEIRSVEGVLNSETSILLSSVLR